MKRQAVQIAVDGDGNLYALASDGTIWTQGTRGWDKVEALPQDPTMDAEIEEIVPSKAQSEKWRPVGLWGMYAVDKTKGTALECIGSASFAMRAGSGDYVMIEASSQTDAQRVWKGHNDKTVETKRHTLTVGGVPYEYIADVIPF